MEHPGSDVRFPTATYRPDVQGLRAVAVLLVVAGHALGGPSGGYVGVDVFFVISGFLITGLLLRQHEGGRRLELREFYARRARRLLPAAVLVLAVTNVAAWLAFQGERATQTLTDAGWALGFAANVRFAELGTDYFDSTRPASPVQHYWSLAVEEQYYLVWPLLLLGLLAVLRSRRHLLPVAVLALVVASFTWSVVSTASSPIAAYFSTPARAWELGVGALLAVALAQGVVRAPSRAVGAALSWLGLAGVLAAGVLYDARTPFPGSAAALPVLGAALVLYGGAGGARNAVLVNPVSEYLGRISYSLYLWHWPIAVFAVALLPAGPERTVAVVTGALGFAILCFHHVEEPVRSSSWLSRRPAVDARPRPTASAGPRPAAARRRTAAAVSLAAVTSLLVGGWVVPAVALRSEPAPVEAAPGAPYASSAQLADELAASVAPAAWPPLAVDLASISRSGAPEWIVDGCDNVNPGNVERCRYGDPAAERTAAVVGDSIATSWLPALRAHLEPRGWNLQVLTRNQCPLPDLGFWRNVPTVRYTQCDDHKRWALEQVRALQPDLVLASNSITFLDHQSGEPTGADRFTSWRDGMATTLGALRAASDRVVLLGPPPRAGNLLSCVTVISRPADCTTGIPPDWTGLREAERAAAELAGAEYVDVEALFCSAGRCPAVVGDLPVYTDGRHLTAAYARRISDRLGRLLES